MAEVEPSRLRFKFALSLPFCSKAHFPHSHGGLRGMSKEELDPNSTRHATYVYFADSH